GPAAFRLRRGAGRERLRHRPGAALVVETALPLFRGAGALARLGAGRRGSRSLCLLPDLLAVCVRHRGVELRGDRLHAGGGGGHRPSRTAGAARPLLWRPGTLLRRVGLRRHDSRTGAVATIRTLRAVVLLPRARVGRGGGRGAVRKDDGAASHGGGPGD